VLLVFMSLVGGKLGTSPWIPDEVPCYDHWVALFYFPKERGPRIHS
jgi:hypothetical protein